MSEQKTFVFGVTFIILFATLLSTIPTGLLGQGTEPENLTPLDADLIYGFSDSSNYMQDNFTSDYYDYDFNSYSWRCSFVNLTTPLFTLGSKRLIFGFLWLGSMDYVNFIDDNGTNTEITLTFAEIDANANEGFARYSLVYALSGQSAGTWVLQWNSTAYSNVASAWLADALYITHGVGFDTSAVIDTGTLLLQLLTLQLPEVPLVINIIIVAPIWATAIYLIWYIIKETMPFV